MHLTAYLAVSGAAANVTMQCHRSGRVTSSVPDIQQNVLFVNSLSFK